MLTVDEALALVLAQAAPLPAGTIPLAAAHGAVLAEDVTSDIDSPPYDKSIVDGFAVMAADLQGGEACLTILEEVMAGDIPSVHGRTRNRHRGS